MKQLVAIAIASILTASAFGQGQVFFNNRSIGNVVAPIYGVNPAMPTTRHSGNAITNGGTVNYTGFPLLSGTNYTAQVWYGPANTPSDALQPVCATCYPAGTVPFRSTAATAGFIQNAAAAVTLDGIPFGSTATLQMRVWNNQGGRLTTWAEAVAANSEIGLSDPFQSLTLAGPPNSPPQFVGLTSFNLTQVPEPSVIALGVLGLGALLLRRRKA